MDQCVVLLSALCVHTRYAFLVFTIQSEASLYSTPPPNASNNPSSSDPTASGDRVLVADAAVEVDVVGEGEEGGDDGDDEEEEEEEEEDEEELDLEYSYDDEDEDMGDYLHVDMPWNIRESSSLKLL